MALVEARKANFFKFPGGTWGTWRGKTIRVGPFLKKVSTRVFIGDTFVILEGAEQVSMTCLKCFQKFPRDFCRVPTVSFSMALLIFRIVSQRYLVFLGDACNCSAG